MGILGDIADKLDLLSERMTTSKDSAHFDQEGVHSDLLSVHSDLSSVHSDLTSVHAATLAAKASVDILLPAIQVMKASIDALLPVTQALNFKATKATLIVSAAIPVLVSSPNNSVLVVPANPNRIGLILYNNSANSIYLMYGQKANSANAMTRILATFAQFVMEAPIYTGDIWATRNAGSGNVLATELTLS